jgi:hypothetical protein
VDLLLPSKDCKVDQMSGTDLGTNLPHKNRDTEIAWHGSNVVCERFLAYIGDVVFELFVRSRKVWPSKRTSDLQDIVVSIVRGRWECTYRSPTQRICHIVR